MKKLILHIYDWLSARKGLTVFLMAGILGLCTGRTGWPFSSNPRQKIPTTSWTR